MIYLLFSILFSTGNAALLKYSEVGQLNRLAVVGINYLCATVLAGGAWLLHQPAPPSALTVGFGALGGLFYVGTLFLWMGAIARVGIATSTTAMRSGVVWPVLLSIVAFGELPNGFQWAGIALAMMAILLLSFGVGGGPGGQPRRGALWLPLLSVVAGGTGSTMKLFTEMGDPAQGEALLTFIFLFAGIFCWLLIAARGIRPKPAEIRAGLLFGCGNMLSNFFLLAGLAQLPGVLAFPLLNTGVLLLVTLLGVSLWRERPGVGGYGAIAAAVAAILLLSL